MGNKCMICGSENLSKILTIDNSPRNVQGLLRKEQVIEDFKIKIILGKCQECRLVQSLNHEDYLPEEYYEDYVMTTSFSEQLNKYLEELAQRIHETYDLAGKKIVEIGCGDGIFCEKLTSFSDDVVGYEPSKPFRDLAIKRGINTKPGYFTTQTPLEANSTDFICSRAVFEHLTKPNIIMEASMKFLKEGGIGMIEVPSFEKAVEDYRYYDIFADHVAYYTKHALNQLAIRNGFQVLETFNSYNDEFLVMIFQKQKLKLKEFCELYPTKLQDYKEKINAFLQDGKTIAIWGAGAKGIALLSTLELSSNEISYIVDVDSNKIGKFSIGSHVPIFNTTKIEEEPTDILIISAMAYFDEILNNLRQKNFKGEIWRISPELSKVMVE